MRKLKMLLLGLTGSVIILTFGFFLFLTMKQGESPLKSVGMMAFGSIGLLTTTIGLTKMTRRDDFFWYTMSSFCFASLIPFWHFGQINHAPTYGIYFPLGLGVIALTLSFRKITQPRNSRVELTPTVH